MIIAVDFDGTCVTHDYPSVGHDIGAAPVLRTIADKGHDIIIHSMRDGKEIQDARDWFQKNGIYVFGVNVNPTQHTWTQSPKPYAHIYIDDAALGCPLFLSEKHSRPFVNWYKVMQFFIDLNVIDVYQAEEIKKQIDKELEELKPYK